MLYILDEPSIGLHQRDNHKLLATLKHLRDLGNTVIVVEHDEETMYAADWIVDIGPGRREHGGRSSQGTADDLMKCEESITGDYLAGRRMIPVPASRREPAGWLTVRGAGAQPEEYRRQIPARRPDLCDRGLRLRKVIARE